MIQCVWKSVMMWFKSLMETGASANLDTREQEWKSGSFCVNIVSLVGLHTCKRGIWFETSVGYVSSFFYFQHWFIGLVCFQLNSSLGYYAFIIFSSTLSLKVHNITVVVLSVYFPFFLLFDFLLFIVFHRSLWFHFFKFSVLLVLFHSIAILVIYAVLIILYFYILPISSLIWLLLLHYITYWLLVLKNFIKCLVRDCIIILLLFSLC